MRFERVRIEPEPPPTTTDFNFLLLRRLFLLEPEPVREATRQRAKDARPGSPLAKLAACGLYADEQPGEWERLAPLGCCRELVEF